MTTEPYVEDALKMLGLKFAGQARDDDGQFAGGSGGGPTHSGGNIRVGDTAYIRQDYRGKDFQVTGVVSNVGSSPAYGKGRNTSFEVKLQDGATETTIRARAFAGRGDHKEVAIKRTPHAGMPVLKTRAEVRKLQDDRDTELDG